MDCHVATDFMCTNGGPPRPWTAASRTTDRQALAERVGDTCTGTPLGARRKPRGAHSRQPRRGCGVHQTPNPKWLAKHRDVSQHTAG